MKIAILQYPYRLDSGLFNIQRLHAKTKISFELIFDLQYAENATLPRFTAVRFQRTVDVISETYLRAGLFVNTPKTKVFSESSHKAPTFSICGRQHKNSKYFHYLGSNLSFSGNLTNEIQRRINLASSGFGGLREHLLAD